MPSTSCPPRAVWPTSCNTRSITSKGTTFVEHLSQLKRGLIRKRMQKLLKDRATEHVHGEDCDHD